MNCGVITGGLKAQSGGEAMNVGEPMKNTEI